MFRPLVITVLTAILALPAARAQTTQPAATQPAAEGVLENAAVTDHELHLPSGPLKYTATAANLLMKDDEGKTKARVFFVAYEKARDPAADRTKPSDRPLTFVFNGGPGAAAVWLHLGTAGPARVELTADGDAPPPPYRLVENASSWLDATDLVFIDPVGTGFSRPEKGERADQFYGVHEDIASVADFIRLYITRYNRWLSPHFLAGESYGTTRAAGLSRYLLEEEGIALSGIILISSALDFATLHPGQSNEVPYALNLPTYAAAAWYHQRLAPDLQADLDVTLRQVEQWAMSDYLVALGRGSDLSPEARAAAIKQLARFTALPTELIDRANLRIDAGLFQKRLLADKGRIVGRFDARITGPDTDPLSNHPNQDPSLVHYLPVYTSTFNDYVRRVLKYESTLPYEVLSDKVGPWKFGESGGGYLNVADDLRLAMIANPHLKVLFASGRFDLATPYLTTAYTVEHMALPPELRSNVRRAHYLGGHMMYHNLPSLEKLHADVAAFIRDAVPNGEKKGAR